MIIIDYSQVAIANVLQFANDIKKTSDDKEKAVNIIRHAILTSLKFYKKKYRAEYGDLVIACDGRNYWRKQIFEYYKAGRRESREKSDLDWTLIFNTMAEIREDLINYFPYKVVNVEQAEADDVIATLVKWSQDNGFANTGLYDEPQKVLIISSDGDFKQLHKYSNVRQWSPMQKKFVTVDDPKAYLMQHITKAGDDGIPPITCPDDFYVNKEKYGKAPAIRQAKLDKFITEGRDACENDEQRRNWDRNRVLIDFDYIPETVSSSIIDIYTNTTVKGSKSAVMNYLIKNKCRLLLDEVDEF